MPFRIERSNIAEMKTDAVVNATNRHLSLDTGVAEELRLAAGEELERELRGIGFCNFGEVVVTGGYALPAKHIIHTVGPNYIDGRHGEDEMLRRCYRNVLSAAVELGAESLAMPLISAGAKGFPIDRVLSAAVSEIGSFLMQSDMDITLVVYDHAAYSLSSAIFPVTTGMSADEEERADRMRHRLFRRKDILGEREERVPDAAKQIPAPRLHASWRHEPRFEDIEDYAAAIDAAPMAECTVSDVFSADDIPAPTGETFSNMLIHLIDRKNMTDSEVYHRANMSRSHFSKIRCNPTYQPTKKTVLALAVALELNYDQTLDLLRSAGYAFSPASLSDAIVTHFIRHARYNIIEINIALFDRGEKLLAD